MKTKKTTHKRFKNAKDFGSFLGLSELDMEIIDQKKKIIEKLKKARLESNISQTDLAKLADTKQPAIARMESGLVSEVGLDFLAKIALILKTSFTIKGKKAA